MPRHDWIWLEETFEERAAIFYRTGDSEPAEVFERLAATAANVPAVLMGQQQKLWDADPKAVARVWENVLNEIAWGDFRRHKAKRAARVGPSSITGSHVLGL